MSYFSSRAELGSMQLFLDEASAMFHVTVEEDYNDDVVELRRNYERDAESNGFESDLHAPILVTLTRKEV